MLNPHKLTDQLTLHIETAAQSVKPNMFEINALVSAGLVGKRLDLNFYTLKDLQGDLNDCQNLSHDKLENQTLTKMWLQFL